MNGPTQKTPQKTLRLLGIIRESTQDLSEQYGPTIQESDLVADATTNGYDLIATRHIVESSTINLEDRQLFQAVTEEAKNLKKTSECDGLAFSRCDRLSRQFDAALQIALDCRKHRLALRFVRENQWLHPDDPPIQFVMFILQVFGVHTQTNVSLANLKAGQRRAAEAGKLPAGVGPGLLGYTLVGKKFATNSFITVCDEILQQGYEGRSINQITRELQSRGVRTPQGKIINRNTVALILSKARRYAGIWDWGGFELRGLIPPRISMEKTQVIQANLKHNRERSFGFGKRKWLTGRVICGLCRTRYRLRGQGNCECRRASRLETSSPCPGPKIRWSKLSDRVWNLLLANLSHLDVLNLELERRRGEWKREKAKIECQVNEIQVKIENLQRRRRLYSWQHGEGIIGDREVLDLCKGIQAEAGLLQKQLDTLMRFLNQPSPPSPDKIERLTELWSAVIAIHLEDASDGIRDRLAEILDLGVTIFPGDLACSYRLQLTANIPLEIEGLSESRDKLDIVLPPLRRL